MRHHKHPSHGWKLNYTHGLKRGKLRFNRHGLKGVLKHFMRKIKHRLRKR